MVDEVFFRFDLNLDVYVIGLDAQRDDLVVLVGLFRCFSDEVLNGPNSLGREFAFVQVNHV